MSSLFTSEYLGSLSDQDSSSLLSVLPALPYQRFVLPNGLVLIVHENQDLPQVAVHLFYRVGAKDEPEGLRGFAHLFEHLMFSGSDNLPGSYVTHLQNAGASELNGTTTADTTHYFECVPAGALDFVLFAESDRMGAFADSLNQAAFNAQREVVINEMRESVLQTYGRVQGSVLEHLFPREHPYAHTVLGCEDDLRCATLSDARAWFARYYRPNNAVLCLAGSITVEQALDKVTDWFGDIPPGEPIDRCSYQLSPRSGPRRLVQYEWGVQPLLRMAWVLPPFGQRVTAGMHLLAEILTGDWEARLSQRMTRELRIASQVSAYVETGVLASYFNVSVVLLPGQSLDSAEACVRETLESLRQTGPSAVELEHCQRGQLMAAVHNQDDNSSIAQLLGSSEVKLGHPHGYRGLLAQVLSLDCVALRDIAREWITDDGFVLHVNPPNLDWVPVARRIRTQPLISLPSVRRLPKMQQLRLSNNLQVLLVERPGHPVITASLLVNAASMYEPCDQPGLAKLVCGLIGAGAGTRDALALNKELRRLGATFEQMSGFKTVVFRMRLLRSAFDRGIGLFAEMVLDPWLSAELFDELRQSTLGAAMQRSGLLAVLPKLVFPVGHPYAKPGFTEGTEAALRRLTAVDAQCFHKQKYRPDGSRLLVIGDISAEHLSHSLEQCLGDWQSDPVDEGIVPPTGEATMGQVALIHYPGAALATISVVFNVPTRGKGVDAKRLALYKLLGEGFASRMNQHLREQRQLTYGVNGVFCDPPGYCFLGFELTVATENIFSAVEVIVAELSAMTADRPFTADELNCVRQGELLQMSMLGDSTGALSGLFEYMLQGDLGEGYWQLLASDLERLSVDSLNAFATEQLRLGNSVWCISGDMSNLEKPLFELLPLSFNNVFADINAFYE